MDYTTLLQFFPLSLRDLILSTDVSDVMINEDGKVFVDRAGRLEEITRVKESLVMAIQNVARQLGSDIDAHNPILDSRLPDGSRVAALYANGNLTVTIRKFNRWYSTRELLAAGCLPEWLLAVLVPRVAGSDGSTAANILISGGTSSGKSTFAKALLDHVPTTARLIVIEKPRELAISQPNAVRWEASDGVPGGAPPVTVAQLVTAALRHRPDRIIIGEVREPAAAYELLQALNTGHSGSIATIHADSADDAIHRLIDLALASHSNLAREFVEKQVLRSIDYVVHLERRAGVRSVIEACSVDPLQGVVRLYPDGKEETELYAIHRETGQN